MFLFPPIHFLKFLVKSQPQRSYKKGSYKKKESVTKVYCESFHRTEIVSDTEFSHANMEC